MSGGDPEVAEPDVRAAGAGGLEQQVGRLDVAVDDAGVVHGFEGLQGLVEHDPDDVASGSVPWSPSRVCERAALDQVHGEDDQVVLGGPAAGRHDVGVADPHATARGRSEQHPGVVLAEHLGGHERLVAEVPRTPHRAHAAGADLVDQQVAAGERCGPIPVMTGGNATRGGPAFNRSLRIGRSARRWDFCGLPSAADSLHCLLGSGTPDGVPQARRNAQALLPRRDRGRRVQRRWERYACL